ncbi:putative MFS family arabinose efflux permease [Plantactinospora soyae]|uniref:MFS family arabinose efflux permease n=1 Tax=Plantactinospora soyae TaxID=1544732 RepID=A0A927M9X9_9ACTN|nr:putative MFS family arabinose efflux permease [Plantactinospora soyae]
MRIASAVVLTAVMASTVTGRRGPVFGVLALLVYGSVLSLGALSPSRLRRWSADHVVLDSLIVVPLAFLALLLIPALAWWGAALIALVVGMVFVPFAVRRRTGPPRTAGTPPSTRVG